MRYSKYNGACLQHVLRVSEQKKKGASKPLSFDVIPPQWVRMLAASAGCGELQLAASFVAP